MKSFLKQLGGSQRGESLLEVIMAIFVVGIGTTVAANLIISALQANNYNRDSLIALDLATEGIESIRSIRDSNWLRFSYDKDVCWNTKPGVVCTPPAASNVANVMDGTRYMVAVDPNPATFGWSLISVSGPALNLNSVASSNNPYQLYFYDSDPGVSSDDDVNPSNDHDLYVAANTGMPSKFYRMVTIDYLGVPKETAQEMMVTSVVQWKDQAVAHEIKLQSLLSNYQKVK